jgi:phenylpyruvate tautomerase PptA (4-oxalocrotonate tautomerase family)
MPILDVEIVVGDAVTEVHVADEETLARRIADGVGAVLQSRPGTMWVRVRKLPAHCYAENGVAPPADGPSDGPSGDGPTGDGWPVFAELLHRVPPAGELLDAEAAAVTRAIAEAVGRPAELIHVQYAPAAAGRQAFGGILVR